MDNIVHQAEDAIGKRDQAALQRVVDDAVSLLPKHFGVQRRTLEAHISRWNGIIARGKGEYSKAQKEFSDAREKYLEVGDRTEATKALMSIGIGCSMRGAYGDAYEAFSEAHNEFVSLGNQKGVANTSINLGIVLEKLGKYDEALERFEGSLDVQKELGMKTSIANTISNIGGVHTARGDLPNALSSYLQALALMEEEHSVRGVADIHLNIGNVYMKTALYDVSLIHFHKALDEYESVEYRRGIAHATSNIAHVYLDSGDFELSLKGFIYARDLYHEADEKLGLVETESSIGVVYKKSGKLDEAANWLKRGLKGAREIGSKTNVIMNALELASIHIAKGDSQKAEEMLDEHPVTSDDHQLMISDALAIQSELAHLKGNINEAEAHLREAIHVAKDQGLLNKCVDLLSSLRTILQSREHWKEYVSVTTELEALTEEIRGEERQRRFAMAQAERAFTKERREADRQHELLVNVLPESIARRIMSNSGPIADELEEVAVLFLDMVHFTVLSSTLNPHDLIELLNTVFGACDDACREYALTKIKTIGDAYLAVAGAPAVETSAPSDLSNVECMAHAALDIIDVLESKEIAVRIGLNVGPVVAGVVGSERKAYDVWGDTVNVAARMEQTGVQYRVHVTDAFARKLGEGADVSMEKDQVVIRRGPFELRHRGSMDVKGKGRMNTWWLSRSANTTP